MRFLWWLWRTYVTEVQVATNAENRAFLDDPTEPRKDREMVIVLITITLCHMFTRFYGSSGDIRAWLDIFNLLGLDEVSQAFRNWLNTGPDHRFHRKLFWATTRMIGYVVIPGIIIKWALKGRLRDYGFQMQGLWSQAPIYGIMFLGIFPFVVGASYFPGFQSKYPFYKLAAGESLWPYFIAWELLYALQFVGVEFFYRGFMVHGLKRRLGYASVFVMMVPYMMIHYNKPLGECAGSIIAGFVLGTLSLKSRSIWWGAAIHIAVAWSMDFLSLWHAGKLFAASG